MIVCSKTLVESYFGNVVFERIGGKVSVHCEKVVQALCDAVRGEMLESQQKMRNEALDRDIERFDAVEEITIRAALFHGGKQPCVSLKAGH